MGEGKSNYISEKDDCMKRIFLLLAFVGSLVFSARALRSDGDVLPASALQPYGRWMPTPGKEVELIGSAVHFCFRFMGPECSLYAYVKEAGEHNYLQYELDGVYQRRLRIEGGVRQPFLIKAGSAGVHTVWLYKATEALSGAVFVEKIVGQGLAALKRPDAPLIEFIGNSITCAAQADPSAVSSDLGV